MLQQNYLPMVYTTAGGESARGVARDMDTVLSEKPERLGANKIRAKQHGRNQKGASDLKNFEAKWHILSSNKAGEFSQAVEMYKDVMRYYRDGEMRHIPTLVASILIRIRLEEYLMAGLTNDDLLEPEVIQELDKQFAPIWLKMVRNKMLASDKKDPNIDDQKMDIIRYLIAYNNNHANAL